MIDFIDVFDSLPSSYLIIQNDDPRFTMRYANKTHLKNLNMSLDDIKNKGIFEVFPDVNGNLEKVKACLEAVAATAEPCKPERVRYDVPILGTNQFETRYWNLEYNPVLDKDGKVVQIVQYSLDITALVRMGLSV